MMNFLQFSTFQKIRVQKYDYFTDVFKIFVVLLRLVF